MDQRIDKIKKAIFSWPYILIFTIIFFVYLVVNIFVNQLYITGFDVLLEFRKSFLIPFFLLNIFIAFLVPLAVNLSIIKFKELKKINSVGGGAGFLGIFGGLLGGACPGCFAGLFFVFLGLFGVTASLSILPFYGLEILVISIILLIVSIWILTNKATCKIPKKRNENRQRKS